MALVKRLSKTLSNDPTLASVKSHFVPLKLVYGTDECKKWTTRHGHASGKRPDVFIVRADGEVLFKGSGSMPGQELITTLTSVVPKTGISLSEPQVMAMAQAIQDLDDALKVENPRTAMKVIERLKRKQLISDATCYAQPFTELQEKVNYYTQQNFDGTVDGCLAMLRFQESMARKKNRVRGMTRFLAAIGDNPHEKMLALGKETVDATDFVWESEKGDEVPAEIVSFEEKDGVPVAMTLKKKNGKQIGPLPLEKFSSDSRKLASLIFELNQLQGADRPADENTAFASGNGADSTQGDGSEAEGGFKHGFSGGLFEKTSP